jgi:hypothetical protein
MHADTARATKFNVSLPFLLQQAAWLYEHQLLQVREQIMKVDVSHPTAASPAPGSTYESGGGYAMTRTGSGAGREPQHIPHRPARSDRPANGAEPRALSSLSARRDSPILNDAVPNTTARPTLHSPRSSVALHHQTPNPKPRAPSQIQTHQEQRHSLQSPIPSSPSSNSNSSSSSPSPAVPSRLSRRPPQLSSHRDKGTLSDDGDDDDDEPAFMPFASTTNDPSATLRDDPRNAARRPVRGKEELSQASDSSTSSASPVMNRRTDGQRRAGPGPLSPQRTAELSRRKESSDGTPSLGSPSMGSSFSDLDGESLLRPLHFLLPSFLPLIPEPQKKH